MPNQTIKKIKIKHICLNIKILTNILTILLVRIRHLKMFFISYMFLQYGDKQQQFLSFYTPPGIDIQRMSNFFTLPILKQLKLYL